MRQKGTQAPVVAGPLAAQVQDSANTNRPQFRMLVVGNRQSDPLPVPGDLVVQRCAGYIVPSQFRQLVLALPKGWLPPRPKLVD